MVKRQSLVLQIMDLKLIYLRHCLSSWKSWTN